MKILKLTLMIALFPIKVFAAERTCVNTIHGNLCGAVVSIQDTHSNHYAYGIHDFTLNDRQLVLSKDFSSKFLCRAFAEGSINPRPQLPFGYSKTTNKVVIQWTTYSNGDCRPTYADALISIDCYSDLE